MRRLLALFLIIAIFIPFIGCSNYVERYLNEQIDENNQEQEKVEPEEPVYGGQISIPAVQPDSLNPLLIQSKNIRSILGLIFDTFIEHDENLKPIPGLALSWEQRNEGLTWIFNIRENVRWHNDDDLTAHDVKFTLDVILDSRVSSPYKQNLQVIESYKAEGDRRLVVNLKRPFGGLPSVLDIPIISKNYYKTVDNILTDMYLKPIGTGPYFLKYYRTREEMLLEVNNRWWKARPYIEKLNIKLVPDEASSLASFEARLVDLAPTMSTKAGKYLYRDDSEIIKYNTLNYDFIGFNFDKQIFQDKALRKAIAYAINREKILDNILLGHGHIVDIPVPPNSWLFNNDIEKYIFDRERAKIELASSEWDDDMGFSIITNENNENRKRILEEVKKDLSEIGIIIEIEVLPWDELYARLENRNFDAVLLGWDISPAVDLSFAFHSNSINLGSNFISYSNENLDLLLEQAAIETDEEALKELYHRIQEHLSDELPYVSLYFRTGSIIIRDGIYDASTSMEDDIYRYLHQWFVVD